MQTRKIRIQKGAIQGVKIKLGNANLVLAFARRGFVCCGYLDLSTAEKLKDAACVVRGVKTVDDLLKAKLCGLTSRAMGLGIKLGMTGKEALERML